MAAVRERAPYGLLGRRLGHSFSPRIHERLGSAPYALFEREPEEVEEFIRNGSWRAINVTIPYKPQAAQLADELTPAARELGVANTLVRRSDGTILADNTDVTGFAWMLERFCTRELGLTASGLLRGRQAIVLGGGGASQAVQAALRDAGADMGIVGVPDEDLYERVLSSYADAVLLVNTTPVGMQPDCPASPLSERQLDSLTKLRGVVDVIYNPARTGLLMAAERRGLPTQNGLAMLVAQACFSSERFLSTTHDEGLIPTIEGQLARETANVALIGMPGVGKTTTGRHLAHRLGRPFVDIDTTIEMEQGMSPGDYIRTHGEDAFREVETQALASYAAHSGLVIACGGGVVTRDRNYPLLHQNSTIVMLDRPLERLSTRGRPLSQGLGVQRLAEERMPRYHAWADLVLSCTGSSMGDAKALSTRLGLERDNA